MEEGRGDLRFPFRSIAEQFHMIDQGSTPLVVPWHDAAELVEELRKRDRLGLPPTRELTRALQQVSVAVFPQDFARLKASGALSFAGPDGRFPVLERPDLYDPVVGLMAADGARPADSNIF